MMNLQFNTFKNVNSNCNIEKHTTVKTIFYMCFTCFSMLVKISVLFKARQRLLKP